MLFLTTKFTVICYSHNKKLIHIYELPKFPGCPCLGFQGGSSLQSLLLTCTSPRGPWGPCLDVQGDTSPLLAMLAHTSGHLSECLDAHVSELSPFSSHNMAISRSPGALGHDCFWILSPNGFRISVLSVPGSKNSMPGEGTLLLVNTPQITKGLTNRL